MKIALLLSGEMREYKHCYENLLKSIGNENNIDVFITTWDKYGGRIYENTSKFNNNTIDIKDIKQKFNPKKLIVLSKEKWETVFSPILKIKENVHKLNYGYFIQTYLWLITFLELKQYALLNNITYDLIIRTRPDIYTIPDTKLRYDTLTPNILYSYYHGCKKKSAKPIYNHIVGKAIGNILEEHKKMKIEISDHYLKQLNLLHYKNIINWNLLTVKDSKITTCYTVQDWFNVSNFENIEIQSYSFLIYLLFLQNKKAHLFLKTRDNNRVVLLYYICALNNIKGDILPSSFKYIVYNNKHLL